VSINKSDLLAANFLFNDTHRTIVSQVVQAYYRLLDAKGLKEEAEASLENAKTVEQAAQAPESEPFLLSESAAVVIRGDKKAN
jgi:outer membrane protein